MSRAIVVGWHHGKGRARAARAECIPVLAKNVATGDVEATFYDPKTQREIVIVMPAAVATAIGDAARGVFRITVDDMADIRVRCDTGSSR